MGFIIVAIMALTIIYGLFGIRVIRPAKVSLKWRIFLWTVLFIFYTVMPLAIFFRFKAPHSIATIPLAWLVFVSFGFFTLAFPALLVRDASFIIIRFARGLMALPRLLGTRT